MPMAKLKLSTSDLFVQRNPLCRRFQCLILYQRRTSAAAQPLVEWMYRLLWPFGMDPLDRLRRFVLPALKVIILRLNCLFHSCLEAIKGAVLCLRRSRWI